MKNLAGWSAKAPGNYEIPSLWRASFCRTSRACPLLVIRPPCAPPQDLGKNPAPEPLVPVDLVVDHSVQVDWAGFPAAYQKNLDPRVRAQHRALRVPKWGQQAFKTFSVVPLSNGIVHQVNLNTSPAASWKTPASTTRIPWWAPTLTPP